MLGGACPVSRGSGVLLNAELSPAPRRPRPEGLTWRAGSHRPGQESPSLPVMIPGTPRLRGASSQNSANTGTPDSEAACAFVTLCVAVLAVERGQLSPQGAWTPVPMMDF